MNNIEKAILNLKINKFKIGDRVMFTKIDPKFPYTGNDIKPKETGTIRIIKTDGRALPIGIEWDLKTPSKHTMNGECPQGYGYWISINSIKKIKTNS